MDGWLSAISTWLVQLVKSIFDDLWTFLVDIVLSLLDLILTAIAALIAAIPAPDFLGQSSLGVLFASMNGTILYFADRLGIFQGLAIVGAGYLFRLSRKFVTLFQW